MLSFRELVVRPFKNFFKKYPPTVQKDEITKGGDTDLS